MHRCPRLRSPGPIPIQLWSQPSFVPQLCPKRSRTLHQRVRACELNSISAPKRKFPPPCPHVKTTSAPVVYVHFAWVLHGVWFWALVIYCALGLLCPRSRSFCVWYAFRYGAMTLLCTRSGSLWVWVWGCATRVRRQPGLGCNSVDCARADVGTRGKGEYGVDWAFEEWSTCESLLIAAVIFTYPVELQRRMSGCARKRTEDDGIDCACSWVPSSLAVPLPLLHFHVHSRAQLE